MNAPVLLLLWIPYFAVPVYAWKWRARQLEAGGSTRPAYVVIGIWLLGFVLLVRYILSMAWYGEHSTLKTDIIDGIWIAFVFVLYPAANYFYLRRMSTKPKGSSSS